MRDGWGKFGAGCLGVVAGVVIAAVAMRVVIAAVAMRDDLDDRLAERIGKTVGHQVDAAFWRERERKRAGRGRSADA